MPRCAGRGYQTSLSMVLPSTMPRKGKHIARFFVRENDIDACLVTLHSPHLVLGNLRNDPSGCRHSAQFRQSVYRFRDCRVWNRSSIGSSFHRPPLRGSRWATPHCSRSARGSKENQKYCLVVILHKTLSEEKCAPHVKLLRLRPAACGVVRRDRRNVSMSRAEAADRECFPGPEQTRTDTGPSIHRLAIR